MLHLKAATWPHCARPAVVLEQGCRWTGDCKALQVRQTSVPGGLWLLSVSVSVSAMQEPTRCYRLHPPMKVQIADMPGGGCALRDWSTALYPGDLDRGGSCCHSQTGGARSAGQPDARTIAGWSHRPLHAETAVGARLCALHGCMQVCLPFREFRGVNRVRAFRGNPGINMHIKPAHAARHH